MILTPSAPRTRRIEASNASFLARFARDRAARNRRGRRPVTLGGLGRTRRRSLPSTALPVLMSGH